jgi:hypothetical protein
LDYQQNKGRKIKIKIVLKMKRILLASVLICLVAAPAVSVLATSYNAPATVPPGEQLDIMTVLENVVNWLFSILLVVAAIFIIVAAYYFVTATGNPETISKARTFVLWALVGVAVAVAARGLVALVRRIVGT